MSQVFTCHELVITCEVLVGMQWSGLSVAFLFLKAFTPTSTISKEERTVQPAPLPVFFKNFFKTFKFKTCEYLM